MKLFFRFSEYHYTSPVLEAFAIIVGIIALSFVPAGAVSAPLAIVIAATAFALPGMYALVNGPPFKPTNDEKIRTVLALARLGPGTRFYDLGCGDGRMVRAAARTGTTAVGYELSLPLVLLGKLRCRGQKTAAVRYGNFWKKDYEDADVIFCFLVPSAMQRFRDDIWPRLPAGCTVLSHTFPIPGLHCDRERSGILLYRRSA